MTIQARLPKIAVLLTAMTIAVSSAAWAQTTGPTAWAAWVGCWQPVLEEVEGQAVSASSPGTSICVLPGSTPAEAELVTVVDGAIIARQALNGTGTRVPVEREGCVGWESSEVAADGSRVYRDSEFDCGGMLTRRTSGIYSMVPRGEWLDVGGVTVREYTEVRVARYRPVTALAAFPAEVRNAVEGRGMQVDMARTAAAEQLAITDVVESLDKVEPTVVEAWLIERGDGFAMDAEKLREVKAAGVPDRVVDLMVALSYPDLFAIDRSDREGEFIEQEVLADAGSRDSRPLSPYDDWYYRRYDPWFYDPYGRYYSDYRGRWYGAPVIIIRDPGDGGGTAEPQRTRLVNGRGFTRGGSGGNSTGGDTVDRSGPSTGSSSSGASSSDSSSDRPASPAPATRTAKPRSE